MDQKKVGGFLKVLRKEKELTQEQLAELLNVSNRTVSRWETGSNLPDLDLLIELADYYDVEIRELLSGERRRETMDKELTETVLKVADYGNEEKLKLMKRMRTCFMVSFATLVIYVGMLVAEPAQPSGLYGFISGFSLGVSLGAVICGIISASRHASKLRAFKQRLLRRS